MGKNHVRIGYTLPGVELAAVADSNLPLAVELAKQYRSQAFSDYNAIFDLVDAVCVVTPAQTHFEIAKACLNAGKHLLLEKPFTGNSAQAQELISLANEKGLILAVGFIERFNPAFQKLIKEIKGEKILGIDIKRLSPFPERITDTDVILDMMLHDLDLLSLITPDEIESIRAEGKKIKSKVFDRVSATIIFKTGIIARLEANRVFGNRIRKITVTTDKFLLDADLIKKQIYLRDFSTSTPSTVPVKQIDQLTDELEDFILTIKGKQQSSIPAIAAYKALKLSEEVRSACL